MFAVVNIPLRYEIWITKFSVTSTNIGVHLFLFRDDKSWACVLVKAY